MFREGLKSLIDKNLIRICGRKKCAGRPFVFGTTKQFLEYFGLKSLDDLPKLEEFTKAMDQPAESIRLLSLSNRPSENNVITEENKDGEPAEAEEANRQP